MKFSIKAIIFLIVLSFQSLTPQIKFAWVTDTHIGSPDAENDLLQIVNDINNQDIKFTIITGDVTEKGFNSELIQAKETLNKLKRPYFIIPGNHDTKWSESGCTKFNELFGSNKFIFNVDDYTFIGLNSGVPLRGGGGHISPEDINWLKNRLNKISLQTKIIFAVHHQLDKEIDNYKNVINLLSRFEKVFVIVGHGHTNQPYIFDNIKGAMGRSALSKQITPGYNIVSLFGDSVSIQTIDFNANKEWYRNSIGRIINSTEEKILNQKPLQELKPIFESQTTIVKTGVLKNNKLFFADLVGWVYSINLNGELIWKKYLATSFFARPVVYKSQIIYSGTDGNVYFLNISSGRLLKTIKLYSPIISSPVVHRNNLIIFTNNGKINFINLKNFEVKSFKIAEKNFEASPLIVNDKVFIGNWDNYLYSIKIDLNDTSIIVWKWTENKNFYYSPAACSPLIDKLNRIFISTPDKFISAIDSQTGQTLFRSNEFNGWESIGINNKKSLLFIKSLVDTLYAIDVEDSIINLKWKTYLGYGLDTNPIPISEKSGMIFLPAKDGTLYIIDETTGKLIQKFFLGNARLNDVIIINSKCLIVSNMDGKFFKINIKRK